MKPQFNVELKTTIVTNSGRFQIVITCPPTLIFPLIRWLTRQTHARNWSIER